MIDRYNSALGRMRIEDKIIDLSIALETMLAKDTEISFRLSLFLAHMAADKASGVEVAYKLFRTLYDARSTIVHGGLHNRRSKAQIVEVENDFKRILNFSRACMLYYFAFLENNPPDRWDAHCLGLVLGSTKRAL